MSPKGEGIARVQSLVIPVPNTRPGDYMKMKITLIGGPTANAEIVK